MNGSAQRAAAKQLRQMLMAEAERFASNARFAEEQSQKPGPEASHWYGYARGLAEAGRSMLDVLKVTAPAHATVPASAVRPGEGRPWATVPSQPKTHETPG